MNQNIRLKTLLLLLFALTCGVNFGQISINLDLKSNDINTSENIYLAGNINQWKPNDPNFKLEQNQNGVYQIIFTPPIGIIEFKFTKGSWKKVETNATGEDIPNRNLSYDGTLQTVTLTIVGWKDKLAPTIERINTAAENVSILKEDFFMPQLNRKRKIWIYLPPDYESSKKSYPVLYMHDAQNIFDASTSFAGEWNVDESLNELFHNGDDGIIVVGIENGEETRIEEYTPWPHPEYGGGRGDLYANFIVETLKPYIDNHFRTKPDRLNTGIMGSSLGGLISFYTALKHQDVFSKAGVLSPSFWFADEVYDMVDEVGKIYDMKIYLLGGELESETLTDEINAMVTTLQQAGFEDSEIKMVTHSDGKHNEQYWSREFMDCYLWLFR